MLASQAEIGVWATAHHGGGYGKGFAPSRCGDPGASPSEFFLKLYMQNHLVLFGRKIVHNAAQNAFF